MSTQEQLIEALKAKFPDESQAGLARKAGLSVQRFNNYCTGIRTMDVDAVIGCAQAVGWDVRKTVAAHEIETAPTPRVKALWKAVAGTGMALALGVGLALPQHAQAAEGASNGITLYTLCEVVRRRLRWVLWWLQSLLPSPAPSDTEIEA